MENETNLIVVPEKRETINRLKNNMNKFKDKIRDVYQEKIVDTGISDNIDEYIDKKAKATQIAVGAIGTAVTIILAICPADSVLGEAAAALATPGLLALIGLGAKIEKKIANSTKELLEKKIIKIDRTNDNVEVYNDQGEIIQDVMDLMTETKKMDKAFTKGAAA